MPDGSVRSVGRLSEDARSRRRRWAGVAPCLRVVSAYRAPCEDARVSDEWTSEQVADELRRSRLARADEPSHAAHGGRETDQEAAYRQDVAAGLQDFRGRVALVSLMWMGTVTASYFLFGRNLTGTPGKIYGGVLLAALAGLLLWMMWVLTRYLTKLVRGYRAVKDGGYRVAHRDGPVAGGS